MPKAFMLSSREREKQKRLATAARSAEQKKLDALLVQVTPKSGRRKKVRLTSKLVGGVMQPHISTLPVRGSTAAPEEKVYTGTYVKGIGQMHKSNAVPITNREQALEVATMRRN